MKLALVRQAYTPFGGAERFVERALGSLRAEGVDVTVISRRWSGEGSGFLRVAPPYLGRTWRDAGFAHAVQRIIADGSFDIVQSHERIPGCHLYRAGDGVHATWLELRDRARGGMAAVATAASLWHRYTRRTEEAMFRHPALRAVICNSRMVRDDIARRFGVPLDKLPVIYNGVDLASFHPGLRAERDAVRSTLGIGSEVPVILFVGSGFERKGVPVLLRALGAMRHRDAVVLVVGRDSRAARAMRLAQRLGVSDRVRFLGGQRDVRPYYGAADLFCLPTLYDPMPNSALEALASGLPVVTSTTSGAAELIGNAEAGAVCEALDVSALTHCLDERVAMRTSPDAPRAAVAKLSSEDMARELIALYRRVMRL